MNTAFEFEKTDFYGSAGYLPPISNSKERGFCEQECAYQAPQLIRSVVSQAGLGRFMYLQGRSGRRYVFSSIRAEQVSLYDRALFATVGSVDATVSIFEKITNWSLHDKTLYVHLLNDADGDDFNEVAADLGAV